jgi:hypothetical protein
VSQVSVCVRHREGIVSPVLPGPEVNESYTLSVPQLGLSDATAKGTITITAETAFGVLWGFESLRQLVSFQYPGRIMNAPVAIDDEPKYPQRGLMVNPAIRFMSIPFLKRMVDGVAANKMNFIHIHFTDITSFPVCVTGSRTSMLLLLCIWFAQGPADSLQSDCAVFTLVCAGVRAGVRLCWLACYDARVPITLVCWRARLGGLRFQCCLPQHCCSAMQHVHHF